MRNQRFRDERKRRRCPIAEGHLSEDGRRRPRRELTLPILDFEGHQRERPAGERLDDCRLVVQHLEVVLVDGLQQQELRLLRLVDDARAVGNQEGFFLHLACSLISVPLPANRSPDTR